MTESDLAAAIPALVCTVERVGRSMRTLPKIDTHFWDWTLWLASKVAAGQRDVVGAELDTMHGHLLGPMGARRPGSLGEALSEYLEARSGWEHRLDLEVDCTLGDPVVPVVQRAVAKRNSTVE